MDDSSNNYMRNIQKWKKKRKKALFGLVFQYHIPIVIGFEINNLITRFFRLFFHFSNISFKSRVYSYELYLNMRNIQKWKKYTHFRRILWFFYNHIPIVGRLWKNHKITLKCVINFHFSNISISRVFKSIYGKIMITGYISHEFYFAY